MLMGIFIDVVIFHVTQSLYLMCVWTPFTLHEASLPRVVVSGKWVMVRVDARSFLVSLPDNKHAQTRGTPR